MNEAENNANTSATGPAVRSNAPAIWLASSLIVVVIIIVGALMTVIDSANSDNQAELKKMQEEQGSQASSPLAPPSETPSYQGAH